MSVCSCCCCRRFCCYQCWFCYCCCCCGRCCSHHFWWPLTTFSLCANLSGTRRHRLVWPPAAPVSALHGYRTPSLSDTHSVKVSIFSYRRRTTFPIRSDYLPGRRTPPSSPLPSAADHPPLTISFAPVINAVLCWRDMNERHVTSFIKRAATCGPLSGVTYQRDVSDALTDTRRPMAVFKIMGAVVSRTPDASVNARRTLWSFAMSAFNAGP